MGIQAVSELVAVVLAVSLATERLVLAIRTPQTVFGFPFLGKWLNTEKPDAAHDGSRRLLLQLLSFGCAYSTASWLQHKEGWWDLARTIEIGPHEMPLWLVAVLATGGSSFWKNILGYTKAVRDIRKEQLPE